MELDALSLAFGQLADPWTLLMLVVGVFIGMVIGVLPGLGAPIAIAIALPFTLYMDPVPSFVLLLAIYSGAVYGGSISAIALGIPGTGAAAATVADGHMMFRTGRGGEALGLSLMASVIGGLFATVALVFLAPLLARFALYFGPREYFAIAVFGIVVMVRVAGKSPLKGLVAAGIGVWLTTWGVDNLTGSTRYLFGSYNLYDGLPFVSVLIGVFAISELFMAAERLRPQAGFDKESMRTRLPSWQVLAKLKATIFRSASLGTIVGILPGEGAAVGAFYAYSEAKRTSPRSDEFGTGIPEGVVAPETANNATVSAALIPTLTLGLPGSPAAAILMGALLIQGLAPGPRLFTDSPDIVYSIYGGLFLINIAMIGVGLVVIKMAAKLIAIPHHVIAPVVALLCLAGVYGTSNDLFAVYVAIAFGAFGYVMRKMAYPIAPFVIGFVLGPILEKSFRQTYLLGDGTIEGFFAGWIAIGIYALLLVNVAGGPARAFLRRRFGKPAGDKPQPANTLFEDEGSAR